MVTETQDRQIVINQPAGHVENGETLEQAVIRETLEESGWQVTPEALLGIYAFTPYQGADTYHRVCFVCTPQKYVTETLDEDILAANWLSKPELLKMRHRSPLIMQCIEDFEQGQRLPLSAINNVHIEPS
ncbi:NUDIX domain-containing protein [Marinomonas ostreistagni]|uniref:NUDIX domain-containing protein n=1 Tax=Marinomonas ostreistagni TaxID=359209 RepID=UPI001EF2365B|nr:NUDIX domain-containing protein [Marinomonas ostreistagni]